MILHVDIPDFDGDAIDVIWENGGHYSLEILDHEVVLKANAKGLISIAKQLLYLANNILPAGCHVHLDGFFTGIEDQEIDLVVEKE